jgi:UDP-glucose 4-epimerase
MARIIVLGSTGFVGKALRQVLIEKNYNAKFMIHKKTKNLQKNEFLGDILDKNSLLKILHDDDIVINLVGQSENNFLKFFNNNLQGAMNLVEIAHLKKNLKIIFASTINVYGENYKSPSKETDAPNPMTSYGIVKFLAEQIYEKYSKIHKLDVTILRFSNIYGKSKKLGLIPNMLSSNPKKPVYFSHSGNQYRDFLYVDDAVNGIIQTIKTNPKFFDIFNICSNKKYTPKKIAKIITSLSKEKISYKLTNEKSDEKCIWANNAKANKIINFKPKIELDTGISLILDKQI